MKKYYFTDGRVLVAGSRHSVAEGKKADYLLCHNGKPIVLDAKIDKTLSKIEQILGIKDLRQRL